jgi:hypothetical protein
MKLDANVAIAQFAFHTVANSFATPPIYRGQSNRGRTFDLVKQSPQRIDVQPAQGRLVERKDRRVHEMAPAPDSLAK